MRSTGSLPTVDAVFKELNKLKPEINREVEQLLATDVLFKDTKGKVLAHLYAIAKVSFQADNGTDALKHFDTHPDYKDIRVPPYSENMTKDDRTAWIDDAFEPLLELASKRVQYAKSMYTHVDKQVQYLDKLRASLDEEIGNLEQQLGVPASTVEPAPVAGAAAATTAADAMAKAGQFALDATGRPTTVPSHFVPYTFRFPGMDPIENVFVDPNEVKYCVCQQPSHGEMIGCDNDTCRYEWFHYPCVGITDKPKKKWYCPECRELMGKGRPSKKSRRG